MAGRLKHMERSHRSYRQTQQYGVFNQFHRNAYRVSTYKQQKLTLGQRMAKLLAPLRNAMKQSAKVD